MQAEIALARITAGAGPIRRPGPDWCDAILALRGLPPLQTNLVYAKWMGDRSAQRQAAKHLHEELIACSWFAGAESSRSQILEVMCCVAVAEAVDTERCDVCDGLGVAGSMVLPCDSCRGWGGSQWSARARARMAAEKAKFKSHNTWRRIANEHDYKGLMRYVRAKERHGIAHMQKQLSDA